MGSPAIASEGHLRVRWVGQKNRVEELPGNPVPLQPQGLGGIMEPVERCWIGPHSRRSPLLATRTPSSGTRTPRVVESVQGERLAPAHLLVSRGGRWAVSE